MTQPSIGNSLYIYKVYIPRGTLSATPFFHYRLARLLLISRKVFPDVSEHVLPEWSWIRTTVSKFRSVEEPADSNKKTLLVWKQRFFHRISLGKKSMKQCRSTCWKVRRFSADSINNMIAYWQKSLFAYIQVMLSSRLITFLAILRWPFSFTKFHFVFSRGMIGTLEDTFQFFGRRS